MSGTSQEPQDAAATPVAVPSASAPGACAIAPGASASGPFAPATGSANPAAPIATGDAAKLREFLSHTSFFGGLDPAISDRVIAMLKEHRFAKGEVVFAEGESGRSMYIVREGELIVRRHCGHGDDARLLMMRPGDFFGVTALIEMEPRPFACVAEKPSVLYELTNADLYRLYKEDQKGYILVLQNINRELCRRLRKGALRIAVLEEAVRDAGKPRG